jgi:hypothetical protein
MLCCQTGTKGLADVEDPSEANGLDDTTIVETLGEETKGETSPGSNAIAGSFPEKDSNTATCGSGDNAGKHEHATQGGTRRVYCGQNTITNDEDRTGERKRVKASEEK